MSWCWSVFLSLLSLTPLFLLLNNSHLHAPTLDHRSSGKADLWQYLSLWLQEVAGPQLASASTQSGDAGNLL